VLIVGVFSPLRLPIIAFSASCVHCVAICRLRRKRLPLASASPLAPLSPCALDLPAGTAKKLIWHTQIKLTRPHRRVSLDVRSWCTPYDEFCQRCDAISNAYEKKCLSEDRVAIHNNSCGQPANIRAEIRFLRQFI
jgi:hypothetical protein